MKMFGYILKLELLVWSSFIIGSACTTRSARTMENSPYDNTTTVLNQLLLGYDKRLRPNFGGAPVTIEANMHVTSIVPINEVDMEFTTMFYLRQMWSDPRLAYGASMNHSSITLSVNFVDHVWLPDAFFESDLSDHRTRKDLYVRVHPDGTVLYSTRKKVNAYCPMEFQDFPLDLQKCELAFESYAYSTRDIIYYWTKGKGNSVSFSRRLKLAQYSLAKWDVITRTSEYFTGNFTALVVEFAFERDVGFYIIQTYIPSTLIVVISWVGFWIDERSIPARVSLAITTVLAITTLLIGVQSSLPKVGHIKAIDIFLLGNFFFVFAALAEYALICYVKKKTLLMEQVRQRRESVRFNNESSTANGSVAYYTEGQNREVPNSIGFRNRMDDSTELKDRFEQDIAVKEHKKEQLGQLSEPHGKNCIFRRYSTDEVARLLFPLAYLCFVLIYVAVCGYQRHKKYQ